MLVWMISTLSLLSRPSPDTRGRLGTFRISNGVCLGGGASLGELTGISPGVGLEVRLGNNTDWWDLSWERGRGTWM